MISMQKMSNMCGSVRTQNMSTQKISNSRVCSTDEIKSKSVHVDESESKMINGNVCSTYKIKSKKRSQDGYKSEYEQGKIYKG